MTDMGPNVLLIGRMNHSLFRNDCGDQIMGGHIEGGIEDTNPSGRQRFAENVRDFFGISLLDRNILSRGAVDVDGGRRSGDIEWYRVAASPRSRSQTCDESS